MGLLGVLAAGVEQVPVRAQRVVVPDNTLGEERSQLRQETIRGVESDRIEGGARRGGNLFHSFSQFDIEAGRGAYFNNPSGVENIFSRITGNAPSDIQGTLGVIGEGSTDVLGTANLFLMNPNGIVFGQNSRLDLGGSFVGTTAGAIGFGGEEFSAVSPGIPSDLLVINPSALLFNQVTAGAIENQSSAEAGLDLSGSSTLLGLRVADDHSLVLAGGDVNLNGGSLHAIGGHVDIGGLRSSGNLDLSVNRDDIALSFPVGVSRANVSLSNGSLITVLAGNSGDVTIHAQDINMLNSGIWAGIGSNLGTSSSQAGDIILNASGDISIAGGFVFNVAREESLGESGNIFIQARSLTGRDGGTVGAAIFSSENSGNVTVRASEKVNLDNFTLFNGSLPDSTGESGDLLIETRALNMTNGGKISAIVNGSGNGGDLIVKASESINLNGLDFNNENTGILAVVSKGATGLGADLFLQTGLLQMSNGSKISASTSGIGDSGNLLIQTNDLRVANGSQILASTFGSGNSGNSNIQVSNSILLNGEANSDTKTGILSEVREGSTGTGGSVSIVTGSLSLLDGGQISTSIFGSGHGGSLTVRASGVINLDGLENENTQTGLFSEVDQGATGSSGNLHIRAQNLSMTGGSRISSITYGQGEGGDLTISARELVDLTDFKLEDTSTALLTGTTSVGIAGNLSIRAGTLRVIGEGATIDTGTYSSGRGGNLSINVERMKVRSSQIASSTDSTGQAGRIMIRASDFLDISGELRNTRNGGGSPGGLFAQVNAPEATGRAGRITISTERLRVSDGSKIQVANFGQGRGGQIFIRADNVDVFETSRPNRYSTGIWAGIQTDAVDNITPRGGSAGSISIETDRLRIRGGSISSSTDGVGNAGRILIQAHDSVELIDTFARTRRQSFLGTRVAETGRGNGGNLVIDTRRLVVRGGDVSASTSGRGRAGNITIRSSDSVDLSNIRPSGLEERGNSLMLVPAQAGGLFARAAAGSQGRGGNISIETGRLDIRDGAEISSQNLGGRDAGNITINVGDRLNANNGNITTSATNASGGRIDIDARQFRFTGDSDIRTDVKRGRAGGGNITLNADDYILAIDDSDILAFANQRGGQIMLDAPGLFAENYEPASLGTEQQLDRNNQVDINANAQQPGRITTPDTTVVSNSLADLPTNSPNTDRLLANTCINSDHQQGQFTRTGSGSLPSRPGTSTTPYTTGTIQPIPNETQHSDRPWQIGDPIVEPQGVYQLPSGRLVMGRGCSPS
jgi:filamentous hemagglutinin family protein